MSFVYIISCGNLAKIGYSTNVESRLSNLRSSNPSVLKVVRKVRVNWGFGFEAEVHALFHKRRIVNEWFDIDSEDLEKFDRYVEKRISTDGNLIMSEMAKTKMLENPRYTIRIDKSDWIGIHGTSGCQIMTGLLERDTFIGGVPIHLWWELHDNFPRRCIQLNKAAQKIFEV